MVDHVEGIDLSVITNSRNADVDRLKSKEILSDSFLSNYHQAYLQSLVDALQRQVNLFLVGFI